jgi:hypothetical protein
MNLKNVCPMNNPNTPQPMNNNLCKCGKVGKNSCPNDERCGTNAPQLPDEALKDIEALVMDKTLHLPNNNDFDNGYEKGMERGIEIGATAYANKLLQEQQENSELKRWKEEAKAILTPIWDYADTLKVPLGASKTEAVIKHVDDAKALLTEVFQKHESGLLPDRFIYEKIKTFLYGE